MIRLLYWLIKGRWAICKDCKHYNGNGICKKYKLENLNWYIDGEKASNDMCYAHNHFGCCWGFKPKGGRIEPPEPWPKY